MTIFFITITAMGAMLFIPSYFDWNWFYRSWRMKRMVEKHDRETVRMIYMTIGGVLFGGGLLMTLLLKWG